MGRSSDLSVLGGTSTDNALVNGSFDAVVHFDVQFGDLVVFVHTGIHDISHGGGVYNVFDKKAFDGFVFGDHFGGRIATNRFDVSAGSRGAISSVISSFDSHDEGSGIIRGVYNFCKKRRKRMHEKVGEEEGKKSQWLFLNNEKKGMRMGRIFFWWWPKNEGDGNRWQ